MKKALYYAVRTTTLTPYVVAVTTERAGHRWFGRDTRHDLPTNGKLSDLKGRFSGQETAERHIDAMRDVAARYRELRAVHENEIRSLLLKERREIDELFKQGDDK